MESLIRTKGSADESQVFLYVIQPKVDEQGEAFDNSQYSWRGKTYYTHNLMKSLFASTTEQVETLQTKMNEQNSAIKEKIDSLMKTMQNSDPQSHAQQEKPQEPG